MILLKSHFPYGSSRLVFACFLVSKSPSLSYSIFTTKSRTYFYDLKGHLPSQILSPTYRSSLPLHQCRRHSSVGNSVSSPKCQRGPAVQLLLWLRHPLAPSPQSGAGVRCPEHWAHSAFSAWGDSSPSYSDPCAQVSPAHASSLCLQLKCYFLREPSPTLPSALPVSAPHSTNYGTS